MVDVARVASMNPDNMLAAGLKSDFDGLITKVRLCPWDYDGKLDHHVLAVAVTITPDGEDPFTQHYSAGDLELFVPSKDGETPVDLESGEGEALEGIYAFKIGKKDQLSNSTNWAQFITAALDAGFPREKLTAAVTCFEGIYGHFDRIPQKKRAGLVKPAATDSKARSNDILVVTEIKEAPAAAAGKPSSGAAKATSASSKPSTAAAAKTPTPSTTATAGGDLDSKLVEIVRAALAAAGEEGLQKAKLPAAALKGGLAATEKGKGVKRIVEADFLSGHEDVWVFDAESGVLISVEG